MPSGTLIGEAELVAKTELGCGGEAPQQSPKGMSIGVKLPWVGGTEKGS